ncbi:unnamed protein product [Calypogeia fissa]
MTGGVAETMGEFEAAFDIRSTVSFILQNRFERVALQFPDELLKYSVAVTSALRKEISKQRESSTEQEWSNGSIRLFVMADTTFGSCCADEVAAMHVDAQCIVHYGHTCLSVTSRLPVWFVFGRATINSESCARHIVEFAAGQKQPVLVMLGLSYIHVLQRIREQVLEIQEMALDIIFVTIPSQQMKPFVNEKTHAQKSQGAKLASEQDRNNNCRMATPITRGDLDDRNGQCNDNNADTCCSASKEEFRRQATDVHKLTREGSEFSVGGLKWVIPGNRGMEDYIILWVGDDEPGLTSVALIFNTSTIVRYDCQEEKILTDVVKQSQLLRRRYYLVERAKDANLVGIVVGTLGVAGYGETIQRIRSMVEAAGKKAYMLVMGKPNPSKLANFPECEVFVLVACPQTAILDSKDYLAPVITPFEAELAFVEGKQWTGAYRLDFTLTSAADHDPEFTPDSSVAEPRFSFLTGRYVGKDYPQDRGEEDVSHVSQRALQLKSESTLSVVNTERSVLDIKSGAEYLASRTYQGLDINQDGPDGPSKASLAVAGRTGRASVYLEEITKK